MQEGIFVVEVMFKKVLFCLSLLSIVAQAGSVLHNDFLEAAKTTVQTASQTVVQTAAQTKDVGSVQRFVAQRAMPIAPLDDDIDAESTLMLALVYGQIGIASFGLSVNQSADEKRAGQFADERFFQADEEISLRFA